MLTAMFTVHARKTFKQSILWIETGILAGALVLMFVLLFAVVQFRPVLEATMDTAEAERAAAQAAEESGEPLGKGPDVRGMLAWPGSLIESINMAAGSGLGGFLIIILTGALVAQEYSWRTLHLWLGSGVSRLSFATARLLSLLLPPLLFSTAALLVGGLLTGVIGLILDGRLPVDQINGWQVLFSIPRTAYSLMPYVALTFMLAVLTRSAVASIGGGLAFLILIENIVAQLFTLAGGGLAQITRYLPMMLASRMANLNALIATQLPEEAPAGPMLLPDTPAAVIGIALYTLVFFAIATWALHRQDISG